MDVTAETRMRDALLRSEERQNRALEASRVVLWDYDVGADILYLSERWAELMAAARSGRNIDVHFGRAHSRRGARSCQKCVAVCAQGRSQPLYQRTQDRGALRRRRGPIWCRGRVLERDASGRALRVGGHQH